MKRLTIPISTSVLRHLALLFFFFNVTHSQVFNVRGNVSTDKIPVRCASVTFTDKNDVSKKYSTVTDSSGNYQLSVTTEVSNQTTLAPLSIELAQNYPNPFSSSTAISYKLNQQMDVSIKIYDILGREIKGFKIGVQTFGTHGIVWDGTDGFGRKVAMGIYFCKLQTKNETLVKKMIFAEGSTTFSMPHLGVISANIKELKKENATQIAGGTFTVEITNVNSTRPKILSVVCQNVIVQQDTALNFQVQEAISAYSLCYERQDTISYNNRNDYLAWAIHLNNNTGTNPKTIMNWPWNNEYPSWSPDGKYIAIMHENSDGVNLYLYDTAVDTLRQLTTSGRINSGTPIWTTDNKKIVYGYIGPQNNETHIIDVDGSGDRKLKINPTGWCVSYIYPDNYTCLYSSGTKLYKSNLDSSFSEFVLDEISTTIRDFNPLTGELLVNTNVTPDSSEVIAEYNVETKQLNVLLAADKGFMISMQRYSKDYSKIVFDEMNTNGYTEEYLSILENGVKRRLVRLFGGQAGGESLDFNPMQFSPDGKYVAFSKNVDQEGPWVWFKSYLFIVDITTGELQYIDMGFNPMWNPKISH